jgi:hypothetical protein
MRNELLTTFRPQWRRYHKRGQHDAHVVLWRCQYRTWHGGKNHDHHVRFRNWLDRVNAPFDIDDDDDE